MVFFIRPMYGADGSRMTYAERAATRRAQEAESRAQRTPETPLQRGLSYEERRRLRKAEELGAAEAATLAQEQERARQAAELAATPTHLRRPRNVWLDLLATMEGHASQPGMTQRIAEYKRRAEVEDERIKNEMEDKARRFEVESNPETAKAREHLLALGPGADEAESHELARLAGLVEGGGAAEYWAQVAPLTQARLAKVQERAAEAAKARTVHDAEWEALQAELKTAEAAKVE